MNYKLYYRFLNDLSVLAENLSKVEKVRAVNRLSKYDSMYDDDFVEDIEIIQNHALIELVHHNIFVAYANNLKNDEKHGNVSLENTLDMLISVMSKIKHYDAVYLNKNDKVKYILAIMFTMSELLQNMVHNRNIYDWDAVINNRIKKIIGGEQYDEIIKSYSNQS